MRGRFRHIPLASLLPITLLLLLPGCSAAEDDALTQHFEAGYSAAKAGQNTKALIDFSRGLHRARSWDNKQ